MTDVEPDSRLHCDGIPPIARELADRIGRYTAFAPVDVVAWHPTRRALLVTRRHGATTQLHLLNAPMEAFEPLTDAADPVLEANFAPQGTCVVFSRDEGGDEAMQLYRLDLDLDGPDRPPTLLTDPSKKHGPAAWNHAGTAICFTSLSLDRHADRSDGRVTTELSIVDPYAPATRRTIARLDGGGWHDFAWSMDDRTLFAIEQRSIVDSTIWSIDVASGTLSRVSTSAGARSVAHALVQPTRDGRRLVFTSDEGGEFRRLTIADVDGAHRRVLTDHLPWDVVAIALQGGAHDGDAELACAIVDVDGRHVLHVVDLDSGEACVSPPLPAGSVTRVRFGIVDRDEIAFVVASARSPGDVYSLRLRDRAARVVPWTRADVDGIDTRGYREAEVIRWRSFDGLEISGLLNRPSARFGGRRPVLIHIHGGPESQATIGFLGASNHFVEDLGIAYLQPNVRGSTGYGRTFVTLDDGLRREDAVRDIGALLDWIAAQPDLDAERVLVAGRSYGGFMSLAVATTYADRIAASIDIVGISDFTSFLERTETYRRDLRRVEYGDERDPIVRAFFDRISPLRNADRIAKPLFVAAGRNDPRVPWQEGEQIVAKVRVHGVEVWWLVADDEGHVFRRKPNIDFVFLAQVKFVERFLLS